MKMEEKIKFKDLNGWLKTTIILLWIIIGINVLYFIAGFILGLLSVY